MRPARLRSVLYVPGSSPKLLEKARDLPADALILDLEDSVAPAAKSQAREQVCAMVTADAYGSRPIAIRVNAALTSWHEADLRAVLAAGPDAIVLPKISSATDVDEARQRLDSFGEAGALQLWAMIETPAAVLAAAEIARSSAQLSVLVMGTNDLRRELGAGDLAGRGPLITSLALGVLGARGAGTTILDGVFNNVRDAEGFESECAQARELGFDGKTVIHPAQIDVCNRIFSPSEREVQHARRVIAAFEAAERTGAGVATLDGSMIERLHVDEARRTLSAADQR
jgi:citrate lyase subunit beta/citryl-CoA lyase